MSYHKRFRTLYLSFQYFHLPLLILHQRSLPHCVSEYSLSMYLSLSGRPWRKKDGQNSQSVMVVSMFICLTSAGQCVGRFGQAARRHAVKRTDFGSSSLWFHFFFENLVYGDLLLTLALKLHTDTHRHRHTQTQTHTDTHTHTHIHTHARTHARTRVHTHTHTHTLNNNNKIYVLPPIKRILKYFTRKTTKTTTKYICPHRIKRKI